MNFISSVERYSLEHVHDSTWLERGVSWSYAAALKDELVLFIFGEEIAAQVWKERSEVVSDF